MTLKYLNADQRWGKYLKRRIQVVQIYNDSSTHQEEAHLDYASLEAPELLHCFYSSTVSGGVLVEQLLGNESYSLITFMAIDKRFRNQGIGTELVRFAETQMKLLGSSIVGVQINDNDSHDFWHKLGFTEETPHQNVTVLLKPELS